MVEGMQSLLIRVQKENETKLKLAEEKHKADTLQTLSTKLSKYLSPQIYESIFSGTKDVSIGSSRKKLTVFFSDIVNFTDTAEQLESEDLTYLLNTYLQEMTQIALKYGATIDKYIGDAIMIFFGDPTSNGVKADALNCVQMATIMQNKVNELQEVWKSKGISKPFQIRIGIHTGYCTVGNFGTENRMDYTIVGSAVNVASRIESLAEPGTVYVSEDCWLLVKDELECESVGTYKMKGLSHEIGLYRVKTSPLHNDYCRVEDQGFKLEFQVSELNDDSRQKLRELLENIIKLN
jgi:class 3 adenylate cyclase